MEPFWCWSPGGWVCVPSRTPWVSLRNSPLRLGVSLTTSTPTRFYSRDFEAFFSHTGTLGCAVCLAPQLFFPVYPHANCFSSCCLASSPLPASCPSPPLLPVWTNVSSLTPWLSDLHTVWFSGSSGYFLFLNVLSFFWLCKEAKYIYLYLHLGWKCQPTHF